jgi:PilZ domain
MDTNDRRKFKRVTPHEPLRGAVGDARVFLVDGSVGGIRIVHQSPLAAPGAYCRVEVLSDLGSVKLDCEIVRTVAERALFYSGLSIIAADRQSSERLKTLFS